MPIPLKKIGRPTKRPTAGVRVSLGLKVTPQIKERLDGAARSNGRTQSQEAEVRLERSFDREDLLSQGLSLAYGRELAGLLLLLASALEATGRLAHTLAEGNRAHAAGTRRTAIPARRGDWLDDPYAFDQAARAALRILEAARPRSDGRGSPAAPDDAFGEASANSLLMAVRGQLESHLTRDEVDRVRALLGPLAERLDRFDLGPRAAKVLHRR